MAKHDADQIAADEAAIAKGICPETGVQLDPETADAHIERTWPTGHPARENVDAARRIALITAWAADKKARKAK